MNTDKCYIDGSWVAPVSSVPFDLVNPATEQAFATVQLASAADVDKGVEAARNAFEAYSRTSKAERIALLRSIIARFEARESEVADAIVRELGAPRSNKGMTGTALAAFRQAVATLERYEFESWLDGNLIQREPIGVCGLITAWNQPAQLIATKLSMALAAGCTSIIKPSEFTPIAAILMTEIMHDAGVPKGVVNLVVGDGPTVGRAICEHPGVDMVSFTGSTRAGILVAEAAARTVKRVSQELGGKSANIILRDADLEAAAAWNVSRGFTICGQSCHAPTRILVHESQRDALLALLVAQIAKLRIGDPEDPATTLGPLVNRAQFDRVQRYIALGIEEGATLVCGGTGRPEKITHGYFVKPTVFSDVTPGMRIAQEEIFGPVLAVMSYSDVDEAIAIANDTKYGLGGYVFARDLREGCAVGRRLHAGRVFLNGAPSNTAAPMGGYKQSGNGRENGQFGLEEFLEVKAMIGFPQAAAAT